MNIHLNIDMMIGGGTGIHRSLKKQKKKKMSNEETGAKFKSKVVSKNSKIILFIINNQ